MARELDCGEGMTKPRSRRSHIVASLGPIRQAVRADLIEILRAN